MLVPNHIPDEVLCLLQERFSVIYRNDDTPPIIEELYQDLSQAHGLLCYPGITIDDNFLSHAPNLKAVSNIAAGFNNFDLSAMKARNIVGTNTPGVVVDATADLTFGLLLASARRIVESDIYVKNGEWEYWSPRLMLGTHVHGKQLGIIGLGSIGRAVAKRARGFDMPVIYYNRRRDFEAEKLLNVEYAGTLVRLLNKSDFIVLLTPLTSETKHLIGKKELSMMKSSATLINVSRGPVIEESALLEALEQGKIAGAALDVFENEPLPLEHPFFRMKNVITTPHIGTATIQTRRQMATIAAENLLSALSGERPKYIVDAAMWNQ